MAKQITGVVLIGAAGVAMAIFRGGSVGDAIAVGALFLVVLGVVILVDRQRAG